VKGVGIKIKVKRKMVKAKSAYLDLFRPEAGILLQNCNDHFVMGQEGF
jgi:hypothetical protein